MDKVKIDRRPRYVPERVVGISGPHIMHAKVTGCTFHPAGTHQGAPVQPDIGAIEVKTSSGRRWFGCEHAHINSELRMVVIGFPAAFEEMAKWEKVPKGMEI